MYKVIEELKNASEILVIDLTSGLGTKSYHDENIKLLKIDNKTEIKLPGDSDWSLLTTMDSDDSITGYQNIIVRNPGWPSEFIIFQDYGNHEGPEGPLSFDERVLFPVLTQGSESVGYYDGAISIIYRVSEGRLFAFKICTDPVVPDITRIRQKRPTNIHYAVSNEKPDAKIIVSVLFQYNNVKPNWKEIMIPGMTAWDIHKPSWIRWIMSNI